MMWKWYQSTIVKIIDESSTVKRFWLRIKDEESFVFEAGQFITLDLPIHDKRTKRWRSYSIANAPNNSNIIELCIVNLEGGAGTSYLFENVKIGTEIKFKGPSGNFVLPESRPEELIFICTGTGIAPFRSMLNSLDWSSNTTKFHLIFGCRTKKDILYRKEMEQLAKDHSLFEYSIACSRENFQGYQGYVHSIYLNQYKDFKESRKFYLCGWAKMIDEAVENIILKMDYQRNQVLYELYD